VDLRLRVRCSSGTYIRTLAHDLGERLGVGAHLSELRRTAVGRFSLSDASTLEQLNFFKSSGRLEELLVTPSRLVEHLPALQVDTEAAARVMNGNAVSAGEIEAGMVRICDNFGNLLAIGEVDSAELVARPRVVLGRGDQ
jgi:tRNA pseudouridine55 synthase